MGMETITQYAPGGGEGVVLWGHWSGVVNSQTA